MLSFNEIEGVDNITVVEPKFNPHDKYANLKNITWISLQPMDKSTRTDDEKKTDCRKIHISEYLCAKGKMENVTHFGKWVFLFFGVCNSRWGGECHHSNKIQTVWQLRRMSHISSVLCMMAIKTYLATNDCRTSNGLPLTWCLFFCVKWDLSQDWH